MKKVTLYNDKSVLLKFSKRKNYYLIQSFDDDGKLVGYCHFNIEKVFENKTDVNNYIYVDRSNERDFEIKNNMLFYHNKSGREEVYHFKFAKCDLQCIEITNFEYFKTGLGSVMFKEMEKYAKKEQCCQIYAHYQPYGKLATGTPKFYLNNGFTIEKDPYDKRYYAIKDLKNKNSDNNIERKF